MHARKLAELIPSEYRKEILMTGMIDNAQPVVSDGFMYQLGVYWKIYCEPDWEPNCERCLSTCLNNFKALKPFIIELEKEKNLLDSV